MPEDHFAEKGLGQKKRWSVMVYLAGGSDVSEEARDSLLRMKQVGSTDNIHVIAQFDSGSEGAFTKRYYLSPYRDALGIDTLLQQACAEISAAPQPGNSSIGAYYCHRIRETMTAAHRDRMDRVSTDELVELLIYSPARFRNFILDCVLDEDNYPQSSGSLGYTNAGDPGVLAGFIRWTKIRYPADHSMVILWGHGNGLSVAWDYPSSPFADPGDSLTAQEMLLAFRNDKREYEKDSDAFRKEQWDSPKEAAAYKPGIDIIGFNSCSLGTIEVYRQLLDLARLGIASEGFTPKTSWPYHKILKSLDENPAWEPEEFAGEIVDAHIKYYEKSIRTTEELGRIERKARRLGASLDMNTRWGQSAATVGLDGPKTSVDLDGHKTSVDLEGPKTSVDLEGPKTSVDLNSRGIDMRGGIDLSVCNLKKSALVSEAMRKLVNLLLGKLNQRPDPAVFSATLAAHAVSQSYFNRDFTDLGDFCRALKCFSSDKSVRDACQSVMAAIDAMCIKRSSAGKDVANSYGISIFFPWGEWSETDIIERYKGLEFIKDTKWNLFLQTYRKLTHQFETGTGAFRSGIYRKTQK